MAPERDSDSAPSSSGQSKRPSLSRQQSEVSEGQHRPRQYQKQRHVGRLHTRVPSSKALHKQQSQSHAQQQQQHHQSAAVGSKNGANSSSARRALSPTEPVTPTQPLKSHQRTTSEIRLPWENAPSTLQKSASQSNIKRNRSHGEIHRRTRSTDKIKRHSGGSSAGPTAAHRPRSSKGQVHFDLGSDDQDEDEWVDASGSNSPHLSRKGSINSSTQSSLRPHASSAPGSRPETPQETTPRETQQEQTLAPAAKPEREQRPPAPRKDYPTNRLLKRTPSHLAQPQMSTEMAQATQPQLSPDSPGHNPISMPASGSKEGLTSRFVNTPGSGRTSEGSFYRPGTSNGLPQSEEATRRARSAVDLSKAHEGQDAAQVADDRDDSALVPKSGRGVLGKPVEPSRIQQKLNLQRASSAIETRHNPPSVADNIGSSPLIAVGGPGYDGAGGRDPRMGKLLGQTGMEYLVVRRHQNPVARSLVRLGVTSNEKSKRIPRANTGSTNSKRSFDLAPRHARKISASRPVTPRDAASIRTAAGSSFEGDDENRLSERLSGSSLVGGEDDDGTSAILRSLWEKSMDLSASAD